MKKRGQFYLITAVIIITTIIAFVTISNYYKTKSSVQIYDLKKELEIESSKVLDYIVQSSETGTLDKFTANFSQYAGNQVEIIYITDASGSLEVYKYNEGVKIPYVQFTGTNQITISLDGYNYKFEMTEGLDFYFIISQTIGGEHYVVTN